MVWWSSGRKWDEAESGTVWRPSAYAAIKTLMDKPGAQGAETGSSEPSLWPSTSHGPGLEEWWASPHACLCESLAVAVCLSHSLWGLSLPIWVAWRDWGQLGWILATWGWQLGQIWESGPEGEAAPTEILLLARTGTLESKRCALGLCPVWSGPEEGSLTHLVEIYTNIVTWPWLDLKNKIDAQKSATTNHAHPSPLLFKRTCWKLLVTLGS